MTKAPPQLIVVIKLALVKLAMSPLLVPDVAPGKVPTPVLQLLVVGAAIQLLLNGDASHVALAARAGLSIATKAHRTDQTNSACRCKQTIFFEEVFMGNSFPGATSGTSNGDIASFTNASLITTINCGGAFVIGGFVFDSTNASAYTINVSSSGGAIGTWRLNNNAVVRVTSTVTNRQTINGQLRIASTGTANFVSDSTTPTATLNITGGVSVNNSGTSGTLYLGGTNTGPNIMGAYVEQGSPPIIFGTLIKTNSGLWVLTGNNTHHNNTLILGGTLMLMGSGAIPNSPVITVNGATLNISNTLTSVNYMIVTNSGALLLTNTFNRTPVTIGTLTASNATFHLGVNGATPFTNIVVTSVLDARSEEHTS